jgi:hypothetical protein
MFGVRDDSRSSTPMSKGDVMRNAVHFIGFKDRQGDRAASAIRIFGHPDFWHHRWDWRAQAEIAESDTAIFAEGSEAEAPSEHAYDDSAYA